MNPRFPSIDHFRWLNRRQVLEPQAASLDLAVPVLLRLIGAVWLADAA